MANAKIFEFSDLASTQSALAKDISIQLRAALDRKSQASLMLSGGSTPGPLYQALSVEDLHWSNITVGLVDERWVSADRAESNENLIRHTLLKNYAAKAKFLPMKTEDISAEIAAEKVDTLYRHASYPFDVVVLGMGKDGHTASWFFEAEGLDIALNPDSERLVCAIEAKYSDVTGPLTTRMTLTLYAIASARHIYLFMTGEEKRRILEQAQSDIKTNLPIQAALQACGERLHIYYCK